MERNTLLVVALLSCVVASAQDEGEDKYWSDPGWDNTSAAEEAYQRDDTECHTYIRAMVGPSILIPRNPGHSPYERAGGIDLEVAAGIPLTQRCPFYFEAGFSASCHVQGTSEVDWNFDHIDAQFAALPLDDPRRQLDWDDFVLTLVGMRDDGRSATTAWSLNVPVALAYQVRGHRHPRFAFIPSLGLNFKFNILRGLFADFPTGWAYGAKPFQMGGKAALALKMNLFYLSLVYQPDFTPLHDEPLYPQVRTMCAGLSLGCLIDVRRRGK